MGKEIQIESLYSLHHAAKKGDVECIYRLLANLGTEDLYNLLSSEDPEFGKLPLHFAAEAGHVDVLQLLLPEAGPTTNLNDLVNAQARKDGWAALHFASAHGHTSAVQWLITNRGANINLQDRDGNTGLHLAIPHAHREVARHLASTGADLYILNNDKMMPISFCEDSAMFDALLSSFSQEAGSAQSFIKGLLEERVSLTLDADKRSVLHYAAKFATSSDVIFKLIARTNPEQIYEKDARGDSLLHVAAKSGNLKVLQALKKLGPFGVDVKRLLGNGVHGGLRSPGMYALLYNHRDFFDELVTMAKVEITLGCIIKGLVAELIDKPAIQSRLALFASTLPTYMALYANKDCIFKFLLETKLLSLSQWDDEHKRTCLHWAVVDKRADIVDKLCSRNYMVQLRPSCGIQDGNGKTALQYAFEQNNPMLMEMLRANPGFKEHEMKLERDREVYVQALNAILVSAALIASVTFAGWLQLPNNAEFYTSALKIFWASNSVSFFTAVATMCVTTTALVPTPSRYVGDIVNQLRLAIVMDAGLLAVSLAAVMWAFAAAGWAALRHAHIFTYQAGMRSTVAVGGSLCLFVWLAFVLQVFECTPPKSVLFALMLPSLPFEKRWWPASLRNIRAAIGDNTRFGYPIKLRSELEAFMDEDLVAYYAKQLAPDCQVPPTSGLVPEKTMKQLLSKLDIRDKCSFIKDTHQQRKDEMDMKQTRESATSRIMSYLGTASPASYK